MDLRTTADSFHVPFGRCASGLLVRPYEASRETPYSCPDCEAPLVLRAGKVRAAHFSHKAGAGCGESSLHRKAKAIIVDLVNAGQPLTFNRRCDNCGRRHPQPASEGVAAARAEVRLANGRIVDVGLLDGAGQLVAAIEVYYTHVVNEEKVADLGAIPWVEIDAFEVVRSRKGAFDILKDNLHPPSCSYIRPKRTPPQWPTLPAPLRSEVQRAPRLLMSTKELRAKVDALTPSQIAAIARSWGMRVEDVKKILFH